MSNAVRQGSAWACVGNRNGGAMAIERLRLLDAGEGVYLGGGTIDCDASGAEVHAWEVHVRLSPGEVADFERWQEHDTPLGVDIGGDRTGTAIVGRVLLGSPTARAVLDGRGRCPYPEHSTRAQAE